MSGRCDNSHISTAADQHGQAKTGIADQPRDPFTKINAKAGRRHGRRDCNRKRHETHQKEKLNMLMVN